MTKTQRLNFTASIVAWMVGMSTLFISGQAIAGVIFQDDFESCDRTKTQNGFTWLSGVRTTVNTANPKNGSCALEFAYQVAADQADSFAEQRFTLGGYYKELFVKFDIFIPLNYVHRSQSGSATNNKWFVDVWEDAYSGGSGIAFDVNLWSSTVASFFVAASKSTDPKYNAGGRHIGGTEWIDQAVIKPTDIGKWLEVTQHFKYATGPTSNDGIIELYVKPAGGISRKHISKTNGDWYVAETATQGRGMNNGYLMGWANSGYAQQTKFYIDNIVFSTNPIGLNGPVVTNVQVR